MGSVARWPNSSNAEFSAELILDALKVKEEWASLRDTAKSFWTQEGLGSKKFKDRMYDIYSRASFTVIEEDFKAMAFFDPTADWESFLAKAVEKLHDHNFLVMDVKRILIQIYGAKPGENLLDVSDDILR